MMKNSYLFVCLVYLVFGIHQGSSEIRPGMRPDKRHKPRPSMPTDSTFSASAIERARADGCLDPGAEYETTSRTISSCFAGGFVTETLVHLKCDNGACRRDNAVAKVMYNCGVVPNKAQCLHKRGNDKATPV